MLVQTLMNHPFLRLAVVLPPGGDALPPTQALETLLRTSGKLDGIVSRMRVRVSPWNHLHTSELSSLPIPWGLIPSTSHQRVTIGTSHQGVTIASLSTLRFLPGGSRLPPPPPVYVGPV